MIAVKRWSLIPKTGYKSSIWIRSCRNVGAGIRNSRSISRASGRSVADRSQRPFCSRMVRIPFTVGMIQDNEDSIRFDWAVKSLPWLILTDRTHVVTTEGFGLDDLDDKI